MSLLLDIFAEFRKLYFVQGTQAVSAYRPPRGTRSVGGRAHWTALAVLILGAGLAIVAGVLIGAGAGR
jgi:hypothetical protein